MLSQSHTNLLTKQLHTTSYQLQEPRSNQTRLQQKMSSKKLLSDDMDDLEDGEEIDQEVEGLCFEESACQPIEEPIPKGTSAMAPELNRAQSTSEQLTKQIVELLQRKKETQMDDQTPIFSYN